MLIRTETKRVCRKCGSENVRPLVARGMRGNAVSIWVCDVHRASFVAHESEEARLTERCNDGRTAEE